MSRAMTNHTTRRSLARRMAGLSLIELMIAMTLGLATVGAVGWVYVGTSQTFRSQDAIARLQEGARYAFEVISNDLRMTGAAACSYRPPGVNVIPGYTGVWYANLFEQPLFSAEENGTADTTTEFSDALRLIRADVTREYIVANHVGTALTVGAFTDIAAGDPLLVTDCVNATVFQAATAASPVITHGAGFTQTYLPTATSSPRVYPLYAATYYIDNNPAGVPALYRLTPTGAEELVEGVEDLQVSFGVDSDATADGEVDPIAANPYLTGAQVNASAALGATPADRWDRVVSVRVSLLMRTVENNVMPSPQVYSYNGVDDIAAGDRRIRKVFTHVIKMRNR
jgi:type IV pilus assembly protein PilW